MQFLRSVDFTAGTFTHFNKSLGRASPVRLPAAQTIPSQETRTDLACYHSDDRNGFSNQPVSRVGRCALTLALR